MKGTLEAEFQGRLKNTRSLSVYESDRILRGGDDKKSSAALGCVTPTLVSAKPHPLTTPMLPVPLVESHEYKIKLDRKKMAKINAGLLNKNCVFSTTISNICMNTIIDTIDRIIQKKCFFFSVLNNAVLFRTKQK